MVQYQIFKNRIYKENLFVAWLMVAGLLAGIGMALLLGNTFPWQLFGMIMGAAAGMILTR